MQFAHFSLEYTLLQKYVSVAGIDEVGRGCIAGPVVAGIVLINDSSHCLTGIRDSKLLSESQREQFYAKILTQYPCHAVAEASAPEIDALGIRRATHLAMLRAYWKLQTRPAVILMDGEKATIPLPGRTYQYNKGDMKHYAIAVASILAKVYRDRLMMTYEAQFPQYSFSSHKGYGTRKHFEEIATYGYTMLHRKTFIPES